MGWRVYVYNAKLNLSHDGTAFIDCYTRISDVIWS